MPLAVGHRSACVRAGFPKKPESGTERWKVTLCPGVTAVGFGEEQTDRVRSLTGPGVAVGGLGRVSEAACVLPRLTRVALVPHGAALFGAPWEG